MGGAVLTAPVRLDHVVIAVSDWQRSNAFYGDVVGAELVELDRVEFLSCEE
jgi:catechol 2,3-dioxygenase-like lactoylglutathione lyase family enzyme